MRTSPTPTRRLCGLLTILQLSSRETRSLTGPLVSFAHQYECA